MALVAASCRWRSRTRSSGRIQRAGVGGDLVAEVGAEVFGGAQFDGPPEGVFELELHHSQVQQAGGVFGLELNQEVDVAVGPKVVPQRGPEQCEAAYAVGTGERGEEAVVEGKTGEQLHRFMMPHGRMEVAASRMPVRGRGSGTGGVTQ